MSVSGAALLPRDPSQPPSPSNGWIGHFNPQYWGCPDFIRLSSLERGSDEAVEVFQHIGDRETPPNGWQEEVDVVALLYDIVHFWWCTQLGDVLGIHAHISAHLLLIPGQIAFGSRHTQGERLKCGLSRIRGRFQRLHCIQPDTFPFALLVTPGTPSFLQNTPTCESESRTMQNAGAKIFPFAKHLSLRLPKHSWLEVWIKQEQDACWSSKGLITAGIFLLISERLLMLLFLIPAIAEQERSTTAAIVVSVDGKPVVISEVADHKGKKKEEGTVHSPTSCFLAYFINEVDSDKEEIEIHEALQAHGTSSSDSE